MYIIYRHLSNKTNPLTVFLLWKTDILSSFVTIISLTFIVKSWLFSAAVPTAATNLSDLISLTDWRSDDTERRPVVVFTDQTTGQSSLWFVRTSSFRCSSCSSCHITQEIGGLQWALHGVCVCVCVCFYNGIKVSDCHHSRACELVTEGRVCFVCISAWELVIGWSHRCSICLNVLEHVPCFPFTHHTLCEANACSTCIPICSTWYSGVSLLRVCRLCPKETIDQDLSGRARGSVGVSARCVWGLACWLNVRLEEMFSC